MRILFIGCVRSSYRLLERLLDEKKNVVGVITKDAPGYNADFCDLGPLCGAHQVPCYYVKNIHEEGSVAFIKACGPDIGFCFGWSQLLKGEVIRLFPRGMVGFHPAALPQNRGRHPLIWALALGLHETASSFFMMNEKADQGDIVSQCPVPIAYEDDAGRLYDKVMDTAVEQEMELVRELEAGSVRYRPQPAGAGNTWRKRGKADGEIDFRMPGRGIYNLVRSLAKPYVGAHMVFHGKEYKVWKVQETGAEGYENMEPGRVLAVNRDGTIEVKAGEGGVRLLDYEPIEVKEGDYIL